MLGSKLSADSGAKPGWGSVKIEPQHQGLLLWDWHQRDKSQGCGDGVPTKLSSFLKIHFVRSAPSQLPLFRRIHVSAFNLCTSLFR
jgi:hypothetical protein